MKSWARISFYVMVFMVFSLLFSFSLAPEFIMQFSRKGANLAPRRYTNHIVKRVFPLSILVRSLNIPIGNCLTRLNGTLELFYRAGIRAMKRGRIN